MRKVVVYELLSLDGVAEHPEEFFGWDDELDANLGEVVASQDTVLLGRRSYDEWSGFWPSSDLEPFAGFINAVPKHVATSSPLKRPWAGSAVIEGDVVPFVEELKAGGGADIGVHASISLARSLMAAGVVDELRLAIAPAVVGRGRRLLDDLPGRTLELLSATRSSSGHVMARYAVS